MIDRLEFLKRALMAPIAAAVGICMAKAEEPEQPEIGPVPLTVRRGDRWRAEWGSLRISGEDTKGGLGHGTLRFDDGVHTLAIVKGEQQSTVTLWGITNMRGPASYFDERHDLLLEWGERRWLIKDALLVDWPPGSGSMMRFVGGETVLCA